MALSNAFSCPLVKVSISTTQGDRRDLNWRHETRDIHALFDSYGAATSEFQMPSILTIFQGNENLERVNLALKARAAEEALKEAQNIGKQPKASDLPMEVLYMHSTRVIAIRYFVSISNTRRIQLKFQTDRDFENALSIIERLGCRPVAHKSQARIGPVTTAGTDFRPPTSREPSVINGLGMSWRPDQNEEAYRVTSSHFRPLISSTPAVHRPSSSTYHSQNSEMRRPLSALGTIHEHQALRDDPVLQNVGGYDSQSLSEAARRHTASPWSEVGTTPTLQEASRVPASDAFPRPSNMSEVTLAQLESALTLEIPPKRELPQLKRPGSRQSLSSRDGAAERSLSSADLHTLPKPTFVKHRPNELGDGKTLSGAYVQQETEEPHPSTKQKSFPSAATKVTGKRPSTPADTQKKVAGICKKMTKAKSTSRPSTALSASSANPTFGDSTPLTSDTSSGFIDPANDVCKALSQIDAILSSPYTKSRNQERDSLASYAAMSYEDRMSVLEKMIVEDVQDENFITLCEDVYGCWQRIGLGC